MMQMKRFTYLDKATSKSLTLIFSCQSVTVLTAERLSITFLQSMDASTGKFTFLELCCFREVSHPNFIDIMPIQAPGYPDCTNIAQLSAISQKPSKSLIWISARDKSKTLF